MRRISFVLIALAAMALVSGAAPAFGAEPADHQAPATRQERLTSADSYIPMPTLSAGVLLRFSSAGMLVVDMGLDIPDEGFRNRVRLNQPRLVDALRTALATYATVYYHDRTAPDPGEMTRLMQQAVDHTMGAPGARVLLANIIYQRRQN